MKKSILVFAAVLFTLTAFAYAKWDKKSNNENNTICTSTDENNNAPSPLFLPKPADLYYNLGTRFEPIKKSAINQVTSVRDFFTEHVNGELYSIVSANIIVVENDKPTRVQQENQGEKLSSAQLRLLRSCNYSTHLKISTDVKTESGYGYYSPHLTVVPETQASYSLGKDAFINYLKDGNKKNAYNLDNDKLGFAKLYFTINPKGQVINLSLDKSSGYEKIDNTIKDLLYHAPGKWLPAQDTHGKKVEQELVISFGKDGC